MHPPPPTAPPASDVHPLPAAGEDKVVAGIPVVMAASMNNPQPPPPPPQKEEMPQSGQVAQYSSWTTGLFDCFSDMNSCCLVFWCPCIAFGRIAEVVEKGNTSCCACGSLYLLLVSLGAASAYGASVLGASSSGLLSFQWILTCIYRGKLKQSLNLPPGFWDDCCTHFWCEPCALCQEYRELQNRGYDLSIGWEGNMKKQNDESTKAPVAPKMDR